VIRFEPPAAVTLRRSSGADTVVADVARLTAVVRTIRGDTLEVRVVTVRVLGRGAELAPAGARAAIVPGPHVGLHATRDAGAPEANLGATIIGFMFVFAAILWLGR
jgi:hypothetical protein